MEVLNKLYSLLDVNIKLSFFRIQGDFGAPLMCLDELENSWNLYGVLTREGECMETSHPDTFASIATTKEWISKTIKTSNEQLNMHFL